MEQNDRHGRNLRRGRVSLPSHVYAITAVTRDRDPVFRDFASARCLVKVLREHEEHGRARTWRFVVMPDHLHWLMQLGETHPLGTVVRDVKALSSRRLGQRLWQKGFYDHAVREDEALRELARYIIANPVRAGLVEKTGDYPHWDAVWL
ncbi:MAG TPA: transposase [Gammaproteobacteria bacterium]|nr:transposase [Gammaproteobacteria bacterium]